MAWRDRGAVRVTLSEPTLAVAKHSISPILLCVAVVALNAPAYAQPPAAAAVSDDRADSVGIWNVVAVEWDGKPVDPEFLAMFKVTFQADGAWAVLFKRLPVAEGKSTSSQDEFPKTFEMETLGSEGIKPRRYKGIYQLDGDTRVLCVVADGEPRPNEFAAPRHSGRMLVTLRRTMAK